jgi:hypothetical protein
MTGFRTPRVTVLAAVLLGVAFEIATLIATQVKAVRAHSPWTDDPYDVAVSIAQVVVPVLGVAIVLRLLAGTSVASVDRTRQLLRAALVLATVVDATLLSEAASLVAGHGSSDPTTVALVATLGVLGLLAAVVTGALVGHGALTRVGRAWQDDWLTDGVTVLRPLLRPVPLLRHFDLDRLVIVIRRHSLGFFLIGSLAGAAVVIGALAVGEGWTDPSLITWAFLVETTSNLAVCLIGNAVAGFVARAPARHPRAEVALLSGCVAVQVAVAFRDAIWGAIAGHPVTDLGQLWTVTAVAAVAAAVLVTASPLSRRSR